MFPFHSDPWNRCLSKHHTNSRSEPGVPNIGVWNTGNHDRKFVLGENNTRKLKDWIRVRQWKSIGMNPREEKGMREQMETWSQACRHQWVQRVLLRSSLRAERQLTRAKKNSRMAHGRQAGTELGQGVAGFRWLSLWTFWHDLSSYASHIYLSNKTGRDLYWFLSRLYP